MLHPHVMASLRLTNVQHGNNRFTRARKTQAVAQVNYSISLKRKIKNDIA